jgi:hypothetical protein
MSISELLVSDVIFREDLYPRIKHSPETVQKYAEDLSVLPPIEVNQHNELIDGRHRLMAFRKVEAANIPVIVTETASDAELLELAIERNASNGLQLSQEDKRDMARRIYLETVIGDGPRSVHTGHHEGQCFGNVQGFSNLDFGGKKKYVNS